MVLVNIAITEVFLMEYNEWKIQSPSIMLFS